MFRYRRFGQLHNGWESAGLWAKIAGFQAAGQCIRNRAGGHKRNDPEPGTSIRHIMEINPIRNSLQDIDERVIALRGYL
jgi:hypothetical protein